MSVYIGITDLCWRIPCLSTCGDVSHLHAVACRTTEHCLMVLLRSLLLGHDFASVEFDKPGAICFQLLDRDTKPEVVQDQELQLKMIELNQWQTADLSIVSANATSLGDLHTHLGISRVSVEHIGEEFTGACNGSNDKSVDVVAVYNEKLSKIARGAHAGR
jgi:hypothetical protein